MSGLIQKSVPALALILALSGAAYAADAPAKADAPAAMAPMAGQGMMMGHMQGLTPEKQELAKTIMQEHKEKVFPLRQELYADNAELEALLSKGDADPAKVKAVNDKIAGANAKIAEEYAAFRQRLFKEVGLRQAPHGMGMMGGGMMGEGGCPMMQNMMGGKGMGGKGGMGMMGGMGGMGGMDMSGQAKTPAKGAKPAKMAKMPGMDNQ